MPSPYRISKSSHPVGIRHALSLNRNNNFSYPYSISAKIQKIPKIFNFPHRRRHIVLRNYRKIAKQNAAKLQSKMPQNCKVKAARIVFLFIFAT